MNNKQKPSNTTESTTAPSNVIDYPELKNIKEFLKKEKGENICVLTPKGWKKYIIDSNEL